MSKEEIEMKYNSINLVRLNLLLMGLYLNNSIFSFSSYSLNNLFKFVCLVVPLIVLVFTFVNHISKYDVLNKTNKKIFLVTSLYFISYFYMLTDISFYRNIFGIFPEIIAFMYLISLSRKQKARSYIFFYKVLSLLLSFSLAGYLLFKFNINISFEKIETNNFLKLKSGIVYLKNYFYVVISQNGMIDPSRFYSFFDEPGTLGTLVGMVFLFDNNYKVLKKERIILFISGILTLSMAFYIFIFFKYLSFPINIFKKISVALSLLIILIFGKIYLEKNYNSIYKQTYGRILNKEDNRASNSAKLILKKFYKTNEIYLGTGRPFYKDHGKVDMSSWNSIVYEKGLLGLFIILSYILYISEFFKRDNFTKLSIVFFTSSIYQRPGILTIINIYILLCGVEYSSFVYRKNKNKFQK
ncbi:MAG: hypothetical protein ACRC6A_00110 [Fusobacteriaceae bacterium]